MERAPKILVANWYVVTHAILDRKRVFLLVLISNHYAICLLRIRLRNLNLKTLLKSLSSENRQVHDVIQILCFGWIYMYSEI